MALLVFADTDGVERSVTVGVEPVLIGRATECAIRSSDPRVSRTHARFYLDHNGVLHIEDLGSSNGVYIGQNRVQHSPVPMNEIITVGSIAFKVVSFAAPAPAPPQGAEWSTPATQPSAAAWGQQPGHSPPSEPQWQQPPQQPANHAQWAPPPQDAHWHGAPHAAPTHPPHNPQWAQPPAPQPHWQQQPPQPEPAAWAPAQAMPPTPQPAATPPPMAQQPEPSAPSGANAASTALLEAEQQARRAAEEERDAYGARMAQLHGEVRALKQAVEEARARADVATPPAPMGDSGEVKALKQALESTRAELVQARIPKSDNELQVKLNELITERAELMEELDTARVRLGDAEDSAKAYEAQLRSTEEELGVARTDLMAAEERLVAEIAAHEERSSGELASRVEELAVTRADLIAAEERILDLSRTVSELQQKIAESGRF